MQAEKTIVLVNGLMCTESYWKILINDLSGDYTFITWDLRGHQYSENPAEPQNIDIESSAGDLLALIDHLNLKRPVIGGYSLGVQIILEFYDKNPTRAAALIIITGPYENPLSTYCGLPVPDKVWEVVLGGLANRVPGITNKLWRVFFRLPVVHHLAYLSGATRASAELMQEFYDHQEILSVPDSLRMALASIKHTARHVLPRINVPTLVIGGEKDIFTPVKLSYIMRDEIPEVDFIMVEKGTHTTLIERPDIVNPAVKEFLENKVF